ncbi:TraI/MobA(P) family conjugative relaxase [Azospirillum oleiclasticum]|uniref:TraI/MobA(P) family conjugative relaxase n=1 Tax=Azospirillum oleiclasticum TaxID=2735135 RepID=UPI003CCD4649
MRSRVASSAGGTWKTVSVACQSWAVTGAPSRVRRVSRHAIRLRYHLVVSFPAGERPTRAHLEDVEETLCDGLGFAGHQRLSAVHTDTGHLHVHIAIDRVHPVTLRAVEPYYDHPKLAELCGVLEARHGLTPNNHMETGRAAGPRTPDGVAALEARRGERSLQGWIRKTAGAALTACREQGRGWADLHRALARYGLEICPRGAGLANADTGSGLAVRASAVDRGLSMAALTGRWGAYAPPTGVHPEPERRYRPQPLHAHPAADDLHARYRRERDQALAARRSALADLRARHAAYQRDLAGWYRDRHQELRRDRRLTPRERRRARLERSGTTQSHICDVEGAQYSPIVDTMARLAEAVGVPLHEMLKP